MATSPSPQQPSTSSASSSRMAPPSAVPAKLKWTLDDKLKLAYAVAFTQTLEFEDGSPENDWDTVASTLQETLDVRTSIKKKIALSDLNVKFSKDNCILQYQKLEEEALAASASVGRKIDPADLSEFIVEKLNKEKREELAVRLARDKKNFSDMLQENKKYEMKRQSEKLDNDEMIKLIKSTKKDVKRFLTKEEIKNFHKKDESESDMSDMDDEELLALNFDVDTLKNFPKLQAKARPEANELSAILDKLGCFNSDDEDDDESDSESDDNENFIDARVESSPSSSPKKLSTSATSSPSALSPGLIRLQLVNPFNVSDPKETQTSPSKNKMALETEAKEKETDQPLTKIAKTLNFDEMEELEETERGDSSPEREIVRSEKVSSEQVGLNKDQESIFVVESVTPKKSSEGAEQEIEEYETPVGSSPAIKVYYYSNTDENKLLPKENANDDIDIEPFDDEINTQEKKPEDDIESKTNVEVFVDVKSVTPKKSEGAEEEIEEYETPVGSSPAVKLYSKPDENKLTTNKDIDIEPVDDEIERQEKTPVESLVKESPKKSSVMPLKIEAKVRVPSKFFEKEIGSKTNDEGKDKQNVDAIKRVTRAQAKIAPISTSDKSHISTIQPNDNQPEGEGQETSRIMDQQGVKMMKIGTGNKSDDEVKEKDQIEEEKRITRAQANVSSSSSPRTPTYTMSPSLLDQCQYQLHEHTPAPAAEEHQDYIGIIPSRTRSRVGVSPLTIFEALPSSVMGQHTLDSNPSSPSSTTTAFSLSNTEDERDHKVFKKQCSLFLSHIAAHKNASIFLKPITDESVEGYTECVKKPMDLSTIRKNIENGKIRKLSDFERHLSLMFLNSLIFNASNRLICKMTMEMLTDARKIIECFKLSLNECQNQKEKEKEQSSTLLRRNVTISESSNKTLHDSEAESENDKSKKGGGRSRKGLKRPAPTPIDSGIERRRTRNQAMSMKKDGRISPDIITKTKKKD